MNNSYNKSNWETYNNAECIGRHCTSGLYDDGEFLPFKAISLCPGIPVSIPFSFQKP